MSESPPISTSDTPLLTIIAQAVSPETNTNPSLDNYPEDVYQLLHNGKLGTVQRASTIAKLHQYTADFARSLPPHSRFSLQLVAHGEAGHVFLDEAWSGTYQNEGNFYALDGNPFLLDNLVGLKGMMSDVILAACFVGNPEASIRAVGGTTLLFTLEQLWGCAVRGATDLTNSSMFDRTGRYNGPTRRWNEKPPKPPISYDPPPPQPPQLPLNIAIDTVIAIRRPGRAALVIPDPSVKVPLALADALRSTYHTPSKHQGAGVAATRFGVSIQVEGGRVEGIASLIFDFRCLVIDVATPIIGFTKLGDRYYQFFDADNGQSIAKIIADLTALSLTL
jgi:hypothetical protein